MTVERQRNDDSLMDEKRESVGIKGGRLVEAVRWGLPNHPVVLDCLINLQPWRRRKTDLKYDML